MTAWAEQFQTHPVTGSWETLIQSVGDAALDEKTSVDTVEDLARLRKVVAYTDSKFRSIDPDLAVKGNLNTLHKVAQELINSINTFKADGNIGHLQNANNHADQLLTVIHQFPISLDRTYAQEDHEAYSETVSRYIKRLSNQKNEIEASLTKQLEDRSKEISGLKSSLDALNNDMKGTQLTLQSQLTEFGTQFQNGEKERNERYAKLHSKLEDDAAQALRDQNQKLDAEFERLALKSAAIIEILSKLQDDASKVYGVTVNTLQGGAYSAYANSEKRNANIFRALASFFMVSAVLFLVFPDISIIFGGDLSEFDWKKTAARIPISIVLFVPAFYFARESGKHRTNEINNRRRQHILSTLDPYITLMDEDRGNELKAHVAKTIFSDAATAHHDSEDRFSLDQVIKLLKGTGNK